MKKYQPIFPTVTVLLSLDAPGDNSSIVRRVLEDQGWTHTGVESTYESRLYSERVGEEVNRHLDLAGKELGRKIVDAVWLQSDSAIIRRR